MIIFKNLKGYFLSLGKFDKFERVKINAFIKIGNLIKI